MSTIKSDSEDLTLNAHGSGNDIKFQSNASEVGSLTAEGVLTATTFAGSGASLTALPAAQLTGTVADARISTLTASKLTGDLPTSLLASIRSDIATLALHSAIADNKAAYNLPSSFIDQFEDDTGIGTETSGDRNTTSEYWGTVTPAVGVNSNTKILLHMDDTSLSDSSGTSVSTTVTGTTRSSAQSKFGGYSALFDGSEYITFANVPAIGSSLWGLDFWWRPTNVTGSGRQTFFAGVTDGQWFAFGLSENDTKLQLPPLAATSNCNLVSFSERPNANH
jgi:hypothetical protein